MGSFPMCCALGSVSNIPSTELYALSWKLNIDAFQEVKEAGWLALRPARPPNSVRRKTMHHG